MNLKLPRYQSIPARHWPEYLVAIVGLYWLLFGPFQPNVSMFGRMFGTALGICVACNFCERWEPSERARPKTRFHFYLRIAGVYLAFVLAFKTLAWLISLSWQ